MMTFRSLAWTLGVSPIIAAAALAQSPQTVWARKGHTSAVNAVEFSRDGQMIASAGDDFTVKLWRTRDGASLGQVTKFFDAATSLSFSPDGTMLAAGSMDDTFEIFRLTDLALLCTNGGGGFVEGLAFSMDSGTLATALGYFSNDLDLFDTQRCELAQILTPHWGTVFCVAYSTDGHYMASGGADFQTVVFHTPSQEFLFLGEHDLYVRSVTFSPDSRLLASTGDDGKVPIWHLPAGTLFHRLAVSNEFLHCARFSPDGRYIAASGQHWPTNGTIHIWRVADGELLQSYTDDTSLEVRGIAYSPDGATFAYGLSDGTVALAVNPFHVGRADEKSARATK
jgi:WD40 repeat protein